MKRVAIFAHYDKDKIVDDYVIYYLNALKEVVDDIIFVSCYNILNKESIQDIVFSIVDEEHDEYDFGSYKRGFLYLKNNNLLENYDKLIFANDSCYGPFYSLKNVFEEMENNRNCDFWGITRNKFGMTKKNNKIVLVRRSHIQSYFLVFSKKVFLSKIFNDFCSSIKHEIYKNDVIINYEIGLSELLVQNGFISDSYIKNYQRFNQVILCFWRQLIEKYNMPFIKCSILRLKHQGLTTTINWQKSIGKHSNYPVKIIEKNLERTVCDKESFFNKIPVMAEFHYKILAFLPGIIKKIWGMIQRKFL